MENIVLEESYFKPYIGSYLNMLKRLKDENRKPLSIEGIYKRRLELNGESEIIRNSWLMHFFDTGDRVISHPNGKIKVVALYTATEHIEPFCTIEDGLYESLDLPEFKLKDLRKYILEKKFNTPFQKAFVSDKDVWKEYNKFQKSLGRITYLSTKKTSDKRVLEQVSKPFTWPMHVDGYAHISTFNSRSHLIGIPKNSRKY